MNPLFSIVIPTFNRGSLIIEVIESILNQVYPNFEVVVVDDGSEDNTPEIIKDFLEDKRIKYLLQENKGVGAARNYGATTANGDFLIFLDSDDLVDSEWLLGFAEILERDSDVELIQSGFRRIDLLTGNESVHIAFPGRYNVGLAGTFALKNKLFQKVKGYDESLRYSENMELLLRVGYENPKIAILEKSDLIYRDSGNGGSRNLPNLRNSLKLILSKHRKNLTSLDLWNFNQTLGVIHLRLQEFPEARKSFRNAISFNPKKATTYLRLLISYMPFISRKVYSSRQFRDS